jgi:Matrixin
MQSNCLQSVGRYRTSQWKWYLGDGSNPAALSDSDYVTVVKDAINNITSAYNNCGRPDYVDATATYGGTTTFESDMHISDGVTVCNAVPDGKDTIDASDLAKNGNPPLATTCSWWVPLIGQNPIYESDVRFNIVDFNFTTNPGSSSCSLTNKMFDVESVMTHEAGHVFGLDHVSETSYPFMTMSTRTAPCDLSARTLGKGDMYGLEYLYP